MQQVVIKYNSSKTLNLLRDLAKYFDFVVSAPKSAKNNEISINGVTILPADNSIDASDLTKIFSGKSFDAGKLRKKAWKRRK